VDLPALAAQTRYRDEPANIRLLCMHQTVEGAQVGVQNYTFRSGPDVIPGRDIPGDVAAVLAGHIHRAQVLRRDLSGRPLAAPVVYPGSVERTAFAEREETKGYAVLELAPTSDGRGRLLAVRFVSLPTRPMVVLTAPIADLSRDELQAVLGNRLMNLDPCSIVSIDVSGELTPPLAEVLTASALRALAPPTMNVTIRWPREKTLNRGPCGRI
jgi:DNA repair exonuclease SbcCD nuclease subunit